MRAELRIPGRQPVPVSAWLDLPYKPKSLIDYKILIEVNDTKDIPSDRDVSIHLSFNKYVVPQDIGFAPIYRRLVMMTPKPVGVVMPPEPRVQGESGDWVTSEGVDIVVPGDQLRAQPKVEASGHTILSEYLGKPLTHVLNCAYLASHLNSGRQIDLPYNQKAWCLTRSW